MSTLTTQHMSRRAMLKGTALSGAALLLAPSCLYAASAKNSIPHSQTRIMLGTFVSITAMHESSTLAEQAMGQAFEKALQLETILNRHTSSSAVAELNTQGKITNAPPELMHVLTRAHAMHGITGGAFDMTVAPLLNLYASQKNIQGNMQLDVTALKHAQSLVQAREVRLSKNKASLGRQGMALTLDGIAKGYIADQMAEELKKEGLHNFLVNAGGDIRINGLKAPNTPWRIGIENPQNKGQSLVTSLPVFDAIATSGSYEMYYDAQKNYHHLIDPVQKHSQRHTLSVTVTAPTALEADALATALSILPTRKALELINSLPGRECCILTSQNQLLKSQGWRT